MKPSPYLESGERLADVIAAIQALGSYKFYKLNFAKWSQRIHGDEGHAAHWETVFVQHPEFFRLDSERKRASLVWRRQRQKLYDVDQEQMISRSEYKALSPLERQRISRKPLSSAEIETLVRTAIDLHSRALEHKQELRWWVSGAIGLVGVLLGALIS